MSAPLSQIKAAAHCTEQDATVREYGKMGSRGENGANVAYLPDVALLLLESYPGSTEVEALRAKIAQSDQVRDVQVSRGNGSYCYDDETVDELKRLLSAARHSVAHHNEAHESSPVLEGASSSPESGSGVERSDEEEDG